MLLQWEGMDQQLLVLETMAELLDVHRPVQVMETHEAAGECAVCLCTGSALPCAFPQVLAGSIHSHGVLSRVFEALMAALWEEKTPIQLPLSTSLLAKGSARGSFTTSESLARDLFPSAAVFTASSDSRSDQVSGSDVLGLINPPASS
ncbi:uncharacterized protein LOC135450903 isoform X3 [Zonotrichia leucophrys gambelii]|uniref:uncharacterized protein LOC135450903 isoform X3 n=1 Tax=Zonotrichia leucophrys gambelii TaxID=257770 RepID=UPI0031400A53